MGVSKRLHTARTMGVARPRIQGGGVLIEGSLAWFFDCPNVQRAIEKRQLKFLRNWGGRVRRVARSSVKRKGAARRPPKRKYKVGTQTWTRAYRRWRQEVQEQPASPAGTPPYTHSGLLKTAILFAFDPLRKSVVVGPSEHIIASIGALHEYGGQRMAATYPARPFMRPARDEANRNLGQLWPKT